MKPMHIPGLIVNDQCMLFQRKNGNTMQYGSIYQHYLMHLVLQTNNNNITAFISYTSLYSTMLIYKYTIVHYNFLSMLKIY